MPLEVPADQAAPIAASTSRLSGVIVFVLLLLSVGFATAGQLVLKEAMARVGRIGTAQVNAAGDTIGRMVSEPLLWLGLTLFGVSALFWLVVLSHVPLSLAYPVVGISYILIVAFARFIRHEPVPSLRWLGVVLIACGIAVIGFSFKRTTGG